MRRPYNGSYPVTREFGVYDPAYANYPGSKHPGTDYGCPEDTQLVAAITGTVKTFIVGNQPVGRGNEVWINNGNRSIRYCHLNAVHVTNGQMVTEGQPIGLVGWTGFVEPKSPKGSHLHFETLMNGVYIDPEKVLNQGGDEVSTVGEVELDMLSRAYFGYGANEDFIKAHKGKESNEMIRWCEANPAHTNWLKQIEGWKQDTGTFVPVGEQLYKKG